MAAAACLASVAVIAAADSSQPQRPRENFVGRFKTAAANYGHSALRGAGSSHRACGGSSQSVAASTMQGSPPSVCAEQPEAGSEQPFHAGSSQSLLPDNSAVLVSDTASPEAVTRLAFYLARCPSLPPPRSFLHLKELQRKARDASTAQLLASAPVETSTQPAIVEACDPIGAGIEKPRKGVRSGGRKRAVEKTEAQGDGREASAEVQREGRGERIGEIACSSLVFGRTCIPTGDGGSLALDYPVSYGGSSTGRRKRGAGSNSSSSSSQSRAVSGVPSLVGSSSAVAEMQNRTGACKTSAAGQTAITSSSSDCATPASSTTTTATTMTSSSLPATHPQPPSLLDVLTSARGMTVLIVPGAARGTSHAWTRQLAERVAALGHMPVLVNLRGYRGSPVTSAR